MTKIRYQVIVRWSDEDQAFIAVVPELPGCAADGKSSQEALTNLEVILAEWMATATELGRPIPHPSMLTRDVGAPDRRETEETK
jgi:predicted RNase H-like HicB family nuclease